METQLVEHKKSFGKEVIISLAAFANTEGGSVVVGVDDDGNPCGLEVGPETVQRYLNEIKVATYPQLVPKARVHVNLSYHFDGSLERRERWQYPMEALRELLLNAVVHRDYKNPSDIVIKIFDDRIIFTNPGKLYGNLQIEDLQRNDYVSSIRNRLLAEAFFLMGDIERYGTGFVRIREVLSSYTEIGFKIEEIGDFFKAELHQTGSTSSPITPHDTPHDTPHVEKLLLCCEKPAGREQLQEKLGIRDRKYFYKTFLRPALKTGLLEMTIPEKPRSKLQKYQLTEAGWQWLAGRRQS